MNKIFLYINIIGELCFFQKYSPFTATIFMLLLLCLKGQAQISVPTPKPSSFAQYGNINYGSASMLPISGQSKTALPLVANDQGRIQIQQYEKDLQTRNQQLIEAERDMRNAQNERAVMEWQAKTKSYRDAFARLKQLDPDNFSVSEAVFTQENAYFDNKMNPKVFNEALERKAELIRQILQREKLSTSNNTALNYGIMKLYQQSNTYYNKATKKTSAVKPFVYDFEDFVGDKDYTKVMVTKLLASGKGQCHSLPLVYLMIAEKLGAKAYLALAPAHTYIQFEDDYGNMINFETTNGHLVSSNWMERSGFINAAALKARTYMDTLSRRKLYAQCMADLLLGYMGKFGYDGLAEQIRQKVLQVNPDNLAANIIDANIKTEVFMHKVNQAGRPKLKDLPNFPDAYRAYQAMQASYDKIDDFGYQDMPKEAYQQWMQSLNAEKTRQENRKLHENLKKEVEHLKQTKMSIINKPIK